MAVVQPFAVAASADLTLGTACAAAARDQRREPTGALARPQRAYRYQREGAAFDAPAAALNKRLARKPVAV